MPYAMGEIEAAGLRNVCKKVHTRSQLAVTRVSSWYWSARRPPVCPRSTAFSLPDTRSQMRTVWKKNEGSVWLLVCLSFFLF